MSKFTVYDTVRQSDIDALAEAGAGLGLGFDASHPKTQKPVHLELLVQIDEAQIAQLKIINHETYTKFRFGVLFGAGVYKFECTHFEDDIVRASPKGFQIRTNRATVRRGGVGDFVDDVGWW